MLNLESVTSGRWLAEGDIHLHRELRSARNSLIRDLRRMLARSSLSALQPDLIILDEFQRFKYLLDEDNEFALLAQELFNYRDSTGRPAKVLLLSATPYKMYTLQQEDENPYEDFLRTAGFLFSGQSDAIQFLKSHIDRYRKIFLDWKNLPEDHERLFAEKRNIETLLRKVMVRTERLAASYDRNGMPAPAAAKRILIVDDEPRYVRLLEANLKTEGYAVSTATDGIRALEVFAAQPADLILLDIMMPRLDGFGVCQRIREFSNVPIMILTAKGEEHDRVRGLDLGADDYLVKPFSATEMLARVRAVLRRAERPTQEGEARHFVHADLRIDLARAEVWRGDHQVSLSATEYRLLLLFAHHIGKILSSPSQNGSNTIRSSFREKSESRFVTESWTPVFAPDYDPGFTGVTV